MQLMVIVLKKPACLSPLLSRLDEAGIHGATVVESTGMRQILGADSVEPPPAFGALRQVLNPEREQSRTVFIVLKTEQVAAAEKVVHEVTGGFDKPDSGILFVVPVTHHEGIVKE